MVLGYFNKGLGNLYIIQLEADSMKICLISSFFHPVQGGAENHMYYIAKSMVDKGHEVEVFVSDRTREGIIPLKEEVFEGIKIKRFKTWFKFSFSGMFFPGMYKAIKYSNADVFHVHGYRHPFNFIHRFTRKPTVMTLHWPNYPTGLRRRWVEVLIKLFDNVIGKRLLNKFDKLWAVSGAEIPWIKNFGVKDEKIELTPNGIPKTYLKRRKWSKFRKKLGIKNELMVLCLSRIHKTKGFDQVIRVAKCFPKVKFVIAGIDGGFKSYLEKLSNSLDNVIFAGALSEEEKLEAYAATDIFVHPSHYEAFGIVVLEAFSQGCSVLTSNRGGLPWVVGDCGLIFKDLDLLDLKEKLETLIKDKKLRNKLSKKGLKKVKNFTWEKITDDIEKKYKIL